MSQPHQTQTTTNTCFYNNWLPPLENYLQQLIQLDQQQNHDESTIDELIERILTHYDEYYIMKSRIAGDNIYMAFSTPWFNTFERSFVWFGGYKPSLLPHLATLSVLDLEEEIKQDIEMVRLVVKEQEDMLSDDLADIQRVIGGRTLFLAMEELELAFEDLLDHGDILREQAMAEVLDALEGYQKVKFFIAFIQLQLRVRSFGNQRITGA